jgi:hypothetical protein
MSELMRDSFLKEVFAVPWEGDEPVSPSCRDNEVTGVKDKQVCALLPWRKV